MRKVITDSANVVASYTYDEWGNILEKSGSYANQNPIRYKGEYFDDETGFIYLRARYYDPTIGRFITEDPIRSGVNWYIYCGSNPIIYADYTGLELYAQSENSIGLSDVVYYLNLITKDTIDIDRSTGKIYISKWYEGEFGLDGTALLRRIICNKQYDCTIFVTEYTNRTYTDYQNEAEAKRYGGGTNTYIYFDPHFEPLMFEIDPYSNYECIKAPCPNYISLAHELIHAERGMRGAKLDGSPEFYAFKVKGEYSWRTPQEDNEELATVGIYGAYNPYVDITENNIRMQFSSKGMRLRGAYRGE